MVQFYLSQLKTLAFDFEDAVQAFIQAKRDHLTTEGVPAPTAHPAVEAAVRRIPGTVDVPDDFVADYQIVDDTPAPPTLAERKAALAAGVSMQASAAANEIMPPLKSRLVTLQVIDANAVPEDERTEAQKTTMAEHNLRSKRMQAVNRHHAELESQIDDLTDETIDGWKAEPFPN
jgi:hypothetical protein